MATDQSFVECIQVQPDLGRALSYVNMLGEDANYLEGKVYEHPPYPGAKLYFRVDSVLGDRDLLRRVFQTTAWAAEPCQRESQLGQCRAKIERQGEPQGRLGQGEWRTRVMPRFAA